MPVESIQWAILGQEFSVADSSWSWPVCRPSCGSTLHSLQAVSSDAVDWGLEPTKTACVAQSSCAVGSASPFRGLGSITAMTPSRRCRSLRWLVRYEFSLASQARDKHLHLDASWDLVLRNRQYPLGHRHNCFEHRARTHSFEHIADPVAVRLCWLGG